jgi:diamine N-acetyltransferase
MFYFLISQPQNKTGHGRSISARWSQEIQQKSKFHTKGGMVMMRLRALSDSDVIQIGQWPTYPGDMEQMDYALREKGWLGEFRVKPDASCYAVENDGDLIGFTILAKAGETDAEFRIALRSDMTGLGLGKSITYLTLQKGFEDLGLSRIYLIVRKNNFRGIRLYQRLGFVDRGECQKEIQGTTVDFWLMDICREEYAGMTTFSID